MDQWENVGQLLEVRWVCWAGVSGALGCLSWPGRGLWGSWGPSPGCTGVYGTSGVSLRCHGVSVFSWFSSLLCGLGPLGFLSRLGSLESFSELPWGVCVLLDLWGRSLGISHGWNPGVSEL